MSPKDAMNWFDWYEKLRTLLSEGRLNHLWALPAVPANTSAVKAALSAYTAGSTPEQVVYEFRLSQKRRWR